MCVCMCAHVCDIELVNDILRKRDTLTIFILFTKLLHMKRKNHVAFGGGQRSSVVISGRTQEVSLVTLYLKEGSMTFLVLSE